MLGGGTLGLVVGLILAGVSVSFSSDAQRARGTVVALERREDAAYPVVEFTPANGATRKFRDSAGSNPPSYEVGEQVGVLYRPGSPGDARIDGFPSLWGTPLIFGGVGLVFTVAGIVMAWVSRRRSWAGSAVSAVPRAAAPRRDGAQIRMKAIVSAGAVAPHLVAGAALRTLHSGAVKLVA
ncbi:DUF3592 domain-containing protein [Streptomyces sp. UNOB3_S3]|nr:DUF3592 domain-containing protein [Streptomyces sp. UNOB3_S3]